MERQIQVKPGDILLLRQRGVRDRGNLLSQAIARRGRDRYTRVAVVVNDELVADAMPDQGVQLRRWRDIQDRYDLAASCLARHAGLAATPDAASLVFQRASHFYRQRYDVKSLMRTDDDEGAAGQLCSQFMGALYGDLGLRCGQASGPAAWSHDIDAHTRLGSWHQYPLATLAEEHGAVLPPMAGWRSLPDALPARLLDNLQQRRTRSEFMRLLDDVQHSAELAQRMLPQLEVAQAWQRAHDGLALGGDAMLADWGYLYLAGGGIASGRLRLERQFASHAGRVLSCAHQLHDALAGFARLTESAQHQLQQGRAELGTLDQLGQLAENLLAWGDTISEDELADEPLMRIQNYPALHAELVEGDGLDDDAIAMGANGLVALSEIDLVRLDWAGGQRSTLLKTLARLRGALKLLQQ